MRHSHDAILCPDFRRFAADFFTSGGLLVSRDSATTTLRWVGDWPWWAGVAAAVVLGLLAVLLYRRDVAGNGRALRFFLPLLRGLAVALIVLMLSGPVLHHRSVVGTLARLIVCVDSSESMQLTDSAMESGRKISIARRLGLLDGELASLDLPTAAEKLTTARGLVAGLAAMDTPDATAIEKLRADFAARVTEAEAAFAKTGRDADVLNRLREELVKPATELARRELKAVDDRTRAAADLAKFGDTAGRWSRDVSDLFQRQLDSDPELLPLKTALAKFDGMPRWQRLQALLMEGKPEQRILETLAKQHDVQVVLMDNGEVKSFWQPGSADAPKPPSTLPKPEGQVTNVTSALKFAAADESKAERGAVILFSDGQHNSGEAPLDSARILAGKKMPVYTVGLGSQMPPRDLAILASTMPEAVFFEDRVRGEVVLKEEVSAGLPFTLTVKDGDKVVWEKQLVTEGKAQRKVPFEFAIKEIAEAKLKQTAQGYEVLGAAVELTASVSGLEGDREVANNSLPLRFRAVTQKRRILILDGRPRWETRYLKNLFERDEKWEISTVIAGSSAEQGFIRGDKPGTFPNDARVLDSYDLVIFGEVPRQHFKDEELTWLADFVGKRGAAMLIIDGARGLLKEYKDTPLAPLFPVEWAGEGIRSGILSLKVSERGASVGAFSMSTDLATNADTWQKLPAPHFLANTKALPGAEVYLEADTGAVKLPAAVLRPFGAGRVYYHAFDDSWRWRFEVADQYHVKFWNQLASFVAEPPFAARDKFVALDAGQLTYNPGDNAAFRVRLRDGEGRPVTDAAVSAVLFRDGQKVATISLSPDAGGLYRGKSAALDPGNYEMAVESAVVPEGQLKARTQFKVAARESAERTLLSINEDLLRQVSTASGGQYFREEQCDELVASIKGLSDGRIEERDTVLWQEWPWFAAIVALLTLEWILRKRAGML